MRIEWSDAGRVSARRFMRDQDGLRAVGLAVSAWPMTRTLSRPSTGAPATVSASAATGSCTTSTATSSPSSELTGSPDDAARRGNPHHWRPVDRDRQSKLTAFWILSQRQERICRAEPSWIVMRSDPGRSPSCWLRHQPSLKAVRSASTDARRRGAPDGTRGAIVRVGGLEAGARIAANARLLRRHA
jgi:hypothetical protein